MIEELCAGSRYEVDVRGDQEPLAISHRNEICPLTNDNIQAMGAFSDGQFNENPTHHVSRARTCGDARDLEFSCAVIIASSGSVSDRPISNQTLLA
jgi:hypothetical protein